MMDDLRKNEESGILAHPGLRSWLRPLSSSEWHLTINTFQINKVYNHSLRFAIFTLLMIMMIIIIHSIQFIQKTRTHLIWSLAELPRLYLKVKCV